MAMNRAKLDLLLKAAAHRSKQNRFVLVGSAAVLVRAKNIPAVMLMTNEIDIYAPDAEDIEAVSEDLSAFLGEGTVFADVNRCHIDGVSPTTSKMPFDWPSRTLDYHGTGCPDVVAIVPDLNDIAIAKMIAWRDKDQTWLAAGVRNGVIDASTMHGRIDRVPSALTSDIPRHELERRLDEMERFTGRPGTVATIHEILAISRIGPGEDDGSVRIQWGDREEPADAQKQGTLLTYPALAKDLAMKAWRLRNFAEVERWEADGRPGKRPDLDAPSRGWVELREDAS
ncbi:DUF6036 family nucleotidyltransferase [Bosea sp. (in: a-proteobacteria)]|uniref:DUF6036 family nucleotidyltransferase n=1 Tax=Bosea sp. (in: a-proteobacteria) TaxID=1871050 RepID=UPI0011F70C52|nr:DUF6036 family nucleotidyltransferase [Bosea sp. (in: a-proteobacteria)]TAJ31592.1 MAG: hypothetical protein EPO59_07740 [Bosea sp. (in: a-proteobacteria)]